MAKSGIYEIVNLVNGKRYVGSSTDTRRRFNVHRRLLNLGEHHNSPLQRSWKKHGAEAFAFRVIMVCSIGELIEQEQAAIDRLKPEYNLSPTAGNIFGYRFTEEQKSALRGRKQTDEWKEKRAAAHRGLKRSEETRSKIAAKAIGRTFERDEAYRSKISERFKGKPKSVEHMTAFQEGRRARVITDEENAKRSESLKLAYAEGRRSRERSPEYREKIAAKLRERAKDPAVREKLRQQALAAAASRRLAD